MTNTNRRSVNKSNNRRSNNRRSRRSRRRSGWFRRRVIESSSTSDRSAESAASNSNSISSLSQRIPFLRSLSSLTGVSTPPATPASSNASSQTAIPAPDFGPQPPNPFKLLAPDPNKLVFECQLAHGSKTVKITNVSGLSDMYKAIADQFPDISAEDILFCTVNTHKVDMDRLLSSNLAMDDFIFAHVKGQKKEVTFVKKAGVLGLTVTDNSNGLTFIKRILPDSVCATVQPAIDIGDHIEKINGESVIGKRHFQVARILRALPIGTQLTLRLVSPFKNGFSFLAARSEVRPRASQDVGDGCQTLRFFANGQSTVQEAPNKVLLAKINKVFEEYLGVNDDELALSIWELGRGCGDLMEMEDKLRASEDLSAFSFPDELIFDMWGIVDDHKNNRIQKEKEMDDGKSAHPDLKIE
ncbi:unnamed protein product [Bursaphelenchus xylophilus]|uniref:(pine wood nematode) hypothetical protein n=1 Tax=Bursaphelenchus xylophilus TaxID=6326 RepID=A0A1I7RSR2_BURXY|nr:unnamed protein product [Bursaphelenchus xylophilus]CAG9122830.1 unnamed protein product [Bursaphelenchus xylophilus]